MKRLKENSRSAFFCIIGHVSSMTAMRPIYSPQPMATANHGMFIEWKNNDSIRGILEGIN